MNIIWLNAIVIDLNNTMYKTLMRSIKKDYVYWKNKKIGEIQIKCHIFLYWFYTKKHG